MFWICGFNGFQQLNSLTDNYDSSDENLISKFVKCKEDSCINLDMTWSNVLVTKEKYAVLSGFINGKPDQTVILEIPDKQDIIQGICTRLESCLFVTNEGKCWQYNMKNLDWKQINNLYLPSELIQNTKLIKIAMGDVINAVLTDTGSVWNVGNQLNTSDISVIDIDCGKEHGILLTETGDVYTWGGGSRGQLGNGVLESSEEICEVNLLAGMKVVNIAAGGWHNAVITKDGDLYTWGWNKQGQLGHPVLEENVKSGVAVLSEPKVVDWPNSVDVHIVQVSCGASHTVVLLENGEIWGCGWNRWGQLGTKNIKSTYLMTKLEISPTISVKKIICRAWNTAFISDNT